MWGGVLFKCARRERVGEPAERLAAASSRPAGDVTPLGAGRPSVMPRDVELERALTLQASKAAGVKCVVLSHFAEQRAGAGDVRDPDRDLALEALEELADARNYLVWAATRAAAAPTSDVDVLERVEAALVPLAQAFDATVRLHDLDRRAAA